MERFNFFRLVRSSFPSQCHKPSAAAVSPTCLKVQHEHPLIFYGIFVQQHIERGATAIVVYLTSRGGLTVTSIVGSTCPWAGRKTIPVIPAASMASFSWAETIQSIDTLVRRKKSRFTFDSSNYNSRSFMLFCFLNDPVLSASSLFKSSNSCFVIS